MGKTPRYIPLVIEFGDRIAKGHVDRFHAVAKNILKANQQRKLQPAPFGFLDHVGDVHRGASVLQRLGDDATGFVDVEIFRSPAIDVIEVSRGLDIPRRLRGGRITHVKILSPHYTKSRR